MVTGVAESLQTFLFTDIVGSTALWERAPGAMQAALARHNEILRQAVESHGGSIFKTVGDACCAVFERASDAAAAAVALQGALAAAEWSTETGALRVRAAINTGNAIAEGGDFFGPALNRTARLTAAAHGGEILVSQSAAELLRAHGLPDGRLDDLGAHRLRDLSEPQHIFRLVFPGLQQSFPPPASLDAHPNNLPSQISNFFGRERESAELRDLLAKNRLVTVCGSGGTGKTRLALQVAADCIAEHKDGTWLVRLADIEDAALVPHAAATTLRVEETPSRDLCDVIAERLEHANVLLLLDNAEHVLGAVAALAHRLLSRCPGVGLLVTSREPLHVTGERVLRLNRLIGEDAARLFVDRANLGSGDRYVGGICERLDGLPLAIEIAAVRVGALTTKQLSERLDALVPVLISKDPSQEQRHRTLRATIDWSYRLLSAKEQRFFQLLSIFEGGFTLEACESVVWDGAEGDPAYDLLDALVDKSFVTAEPHGESMRYRLLESLREYAASKLEASGDAERAHSRHFAFFKALTDRWGSWQSESDEHAYVAALAGEIPNVRAALEWGFAQQDLQPALEMLLKIAPYWQQHCNVAEARAWFKRACEAAQNSRTTLHAKLLRRAATFATIEDDYRCARELTAQSLALFRDLGDRSGAAEALHNLAVIEDRAGSADEALRLYREALDGFEATKHTTGIITALYNLAQAAARAGDTDLAAAYLERGMALCAGTEHADRLASFLRSRGEIAALQGRTEEAGALLERALAMKRALRNRHDEVEVLHTMAALEIRRRDWDAAERDARSALSIARELDIASLTIGCFELFALIAYARGNSTKARAVIAQANALRVRHGYVFPIFHELREELEALSRLSGETAGSETPAQTIEELLRT